MNISGGHVGDNFDAYVGSRVTVTGGLVDDIDLRDSDALIRGGWVDSLAIRGSDVDIVGGRVDTVAIEGRGSQLNVSGGRFGEYWAVADLIPSIADSDFQVHFVGGDFRVNGRILEGLETPGDTYTLNGEYHLSGTLADGSPFSVYASDRVSVELSPPPPIDAAMITLPDTPTPPGVRAGQTLVIKDGASIGDYFNAGWGSAIVMHGGSIGDYFKAVGATVTIAGGEVGGDLEAHEGSVINISGGNVGRIFSQEGSVIEISGGKLAAHVWASGDVRIAGGVVDAPFHAHDGSNVIISGEDVGAIRARDGSSITVIGTDFRLDGIPIDGLSSPGDSVLFGGASDLAFGGLLTANLLDGGPITIDLAEIPDLTQSSAAGFEPDASLTLTYVVPEPKSLTTLLIGLIAIVTPPRTRGKWRNCSYLQDEKRSTD